MSRKKIRQINERFQLFIKLVTNKYTLLVKLRSLLLDFNEIDSMYVRVDKEEREKGKEEEGR